MAEDDIYGNKGRYERFLANIDNLTQKASKIHHGRSRVYFCRNPANLAYFKRLSRLFDSKDNSYIRRLRLFRTLLLITHEIEGF